MFYVFSQEKRKKKLTASFDAIKTANEDDRSVSHSLVFEERNMKHNNNFR